MSKLTPAMRQRISNLRTDIVTRRRELTEFLALAKNDEMGMHLPLFYLSRFDSKISAIEPSIAAYEPVFSAVRRGKENKLREAGEEAKKQHIAATYDPLELFDSATEAAKSFLGGFGLDLSVPLATDKAAEEEAKRISKQAMLEYVESDEFFEIIKSDRGLAKYVSESVRGYLIKSVDAGLSAEDLITGLYFPSKAAEKLRSLDTASKLKNTQGEKLYDAIHSLTKNSKISEQDALNYAHGIDLDKTAKTALRGSLVYRNAEGQKRLMADIAEHYRLIGGLGNTAKLFKEPRKSRAFYRNRNKSINVGSSLTKTTLWHELSHSIEYENPKVLQAVKGFLMQRLAMAEANGKGIQRLGNIYRSSGYGAQEIAIEDGCFDHYVSKIYLPNQMLMDTAGTRYPVTGDLAKTFVNNIRSSEVITMAIECFSTPALCAKIWKEDPNHALFVIGLLKQMNSGEL